MAFKGVNSYGLPLAGAVVRVLAPGRREGEVEEIFLTNFADDLGDEVTDLDELAEYKVGEYLSVEIRRFVVAEGANAAILFVRELASGVSDRAEAGAVRGVPVGEVVSVAPMDEATFFELVAAYGGESPLADFERFVEYLAGTLSGGEVRAFWARKEALATRLMRARSPRVRTDGALYEALAVLFGPQDRLHAALRGRGGNVSDADSDAAEAFARVAEEVNYLQTGEDVAFLAPDTLDGDPIAVALGSGRGVLRAQHGFGFQTDGPDGARLLCVGVAALLADEEDPRHDLEPLVRSLATAHRFGAPEKLRWTSLGVEAVFSGLEIFSQTIKTADAPR